MLTYHSDESLKQRAVEAAKRHRDQDMLLAGTYGTMNGAFRGCSVGCDAYDITGKLLEDGYHRITAEYFGFPEWLERLRDSIFEGLPNDERRDFHVRLKEAIPVGVDIEPVRHRLAIRRLRRLIEAQEQALAEQEGELKSVIEQVVVALRQVRRCHEAEIGQGQRSVGDWSAARSAAESAARSAWSAWSAASSAASAAESATESAASAARSAAWKREAADLIELLAQAG